MSPVRAYEEVIDFIASGTRPSNLINFQPSNAVKERVADLIYREKTTGLSRDEKSELDHYMQLEHLIRLAKARAHNSGTTNVDCYIGRYPPAAAIARMRK
ncbi:MAG: hypothetical protein AB1797_08995 [bacterium]